MAECAFRQELPKQDTPWREESVTCGEQTHGGGQYCVLHDPDPQKDVKVFRQALAHRLQNPEKSGAQETVRLAGTVFPEGFVFSCDLEGNLDLRGAVFLGHAHFPEASIGGDAYFSNASIGGDAYFSGASIGGRAYFNGASIGGNADFRGASISGDAYFRDASIGRHADFREASIGGYADFRDASIGGDADFSDASFGGDADFHDAFFGSVFEFAPSRVAGRMVLSDISARELRIGPCDTRIDSLSDGRFCRAEVTLGQPVRMNRCRPHIQAPKRIAEFEERVKTLRQVRGFANRGLPPDKDAFLKKFGHLVSIEEEEDEEDRFSRLLQTYPFLRPLFAQNPADDWKDKALSILDNLIDVWAGILEKAEDMEKMTETLPPGADPKEPENADFRYWNFAGRRLEGLEMVECVLDCADFAASDLDGAYFDSCKWPRPDNTGYSAPFNHARLMAEFGESSGKDDGAKNRLLAHRNVCQRLKKLFEAAHDYRQAGDFHFREMEIRRLTDEKRLDRRMLALYRAIGDFGENYVKVARSLGLFLFCWPGLSLALSHAIAKTANGAVFSAVGGMFCNIAETLRSVFSGYLAHLSYYWSAVVPRTVGKAFGFNQADYRDVSNMDTAPDPTSLNGLLQSTGVQADWYNQLTILLLLVAFYVLFFSLSALLVMSVRRRFRR
jgi:uncharacterized protein YjbI with pentapeptide repeats